MRRSKVELEPNGPIRGLPLNFSYLYQYRLGSFWCNYGEKILENSCLFSVSRDFHSAEICTMRHQVPRVASQQRRRQPNHSVPPRHALP